MERQYIIEKKLEIISKIKGGLIVSCQATQDEPLYGSQIMTRMALSVKNGGALGLRVNGVKDIKSIKKVCDLPIIGIIKADYPGYEVYITPSMKEVNELVRVRADIIAIDATNRRRPGFDTPEKFISAIKNKYDVLIMADISTYEEGVVASQAGADIIATTLSGYTSYTTEEEKPDLDLIKRLTKELRIPLIAEGNIQTPEQAVLCFEAGAHAVVVGSAITRPHFITKRFVDTINKGLVLRTQLVL